MSEELGNEVIVLENIQKFPVTASNPGGSHPHHFREVECKPGLEEVILEPQIGHAFRERYVRTKDKDEKGRAIFRKEAN